MGFRPAAGSDDATLARFNTIQNIIYPKEETYNRAVMLDQGWIQ